MSNPQSYIEERLKRLAEPVAIPTFKDENELAAYITKAILSKKFRKYAVDDTFLPHLQNALKLSFANKEPIKFVLPFGGYKLWRFDEAPEVDWAELFSLMYYAAWLKPVAEAYEPGVWFDFSSDDVIVERINNIPKSDTQAYARTFNSSVKFLEQYIPKNMRFTLTPVGSRYSGEEFANELDQKIKDYLEQNNNQLPTPSEHDITTINLNANPTQDQLKDLEWHAKNKLVHDMYMSVSKRRPYNRAEDKILVFTKPLPKGVAVGTTKTSVAKFWAGVGALKRRGDSYIETVLSPDQLKSATAEWQQIELAGLEGKNFHKIRVIN